MRHSERDLLDLIDRLYAAAAGEEQWSAALGRVINFFHGVGICLFDIDWRHKRINEWHEYGLPEMGIYAAHVNSIDPRVKFSMQHPADHIAWDGLFITEREMDRHEFYDWQLRMSGARYFLGSRMRDDGDRSSMVALNFTRKHGPPSEREIETFAIIRNHVAHKGGALLIARSSGLPGYILQVLPNIRIRLGDGSAPTAIIYVSDPLLRNEPDLHVLSSAFNLSQRETELASLLLRGDSLVQAADHLAMSRNTARNHLQAIFRKTRTNSQSRLMRLLGLLVSTTTPPSP
jgi:DNA-binding CsgD family transcriptional regulator